MHQFSSVQFKGFDVGDFQRICCRLIIFKDLDDFKELVVDDSQRI
jgi:hypothetical protein